MSRAPETVLVRPVITEKAARLAQFNQYVFAVRKDANKIEVANAIQVLFKVKVVSVRTLNKPGKRQRRGQHWIYRSGSKRAIVTVAKGQQIDISTLK